MKSIIVALVSTTALIGTAFAQNTQGGGQPQTNEAVQSKSANTTGSAPAATPTPSGQTPSSAPTNPDLGPNQPTPNGNSPIAPGEKR